MEFLIKECRGIKYCGYYGYCDHQHLYLGLLRGLFSMGHKRKPFRGFSQMKEKRHHFKMRIHLNK